MNINDGCILPWAVIANLPKELKSNYRPMAIPPTPKQAKRKKIGRNDPCPCGSGKKFKKCCLVLTG